MVWISGSLPLSWRLLANRVMMCMGMLRIWIFDSLVATPNRSNVNNCLVEKLVIQFEYLWIGLILGQHWDNSSRVSASCWRHSSSRYADDSYSW